MLDLLVRLRFRVTVEGAAHLPLQGPALLAANHVSYVDPVVLLVVVHRAGRKARFLVLREVFDHPAIGWLFRAGRHIPVDTGARRFSAIREARAALAAGEVVLVYPEGTIGGIERRLEAKGGLGLLAVTSGVPVVPIGSCGLERLPVQGRPRGFDRLRRRSAAVVIGAPSHFTQVTGDRAAYRAASENVLQRIVGLAQAACTAVARRSR